MNNRNIVLNSDSYKYSQFSQYPPNTTVVYSYIESRGGTYDATVFFGLQAFIKQYLTGEVVTYDMIDEAEAIITAHGEPFNRAGWEYIVREHGGRLPVVIKAVPEGTVVKTRNVLAVIYNTDPECYWLTSFLETPLLRAIWYPTTVATNSYENKKLILKYLEQTGDPSTIDFKLHDFGARGVSSLESAGIGGAAHLVNFQGTDTVEALLFARRYYNADMAGFSVPAMEHSTVTSWGREREVDAYRNMVRKNGKPGGIVSAVSDSYDIFAACEKWGTELKQDVIDSGATLVVRPDSGDPATVVKQCLQILEKHFGSTKNDKGYKVLNNVRVLQGDGINHASIRSILYTITLAGYSADNVVFGQGSKLLQEVARDDFRFAMKASAACIDGTWREVFKDPITDPGKTSKKGRVTLYQNESGDYYSDIEGKGDSALITVFKNGELITEHTFQDIRDRVQETFKS